MTESFSSGTTPKTSDTLRILDIKILNAITGGGGGGGGGITQVFSGAGAPTVTPTVSAAIYINTSNGSLYEWYGGSWH